MKNAIFIGVLMILITGCSKETINPTPGDSQQKVSEINGDGFRLKSGTWRTFYDNGGIDYGCNSQVSNCYPIDIPVTNSHDPIFADVMAAIATSNATEISKELSDNRDVLKNYFDVVEIDAVIDSTMSLASRGTIAGSKVYFKFIDSTNALKTVYPLTF